MVVGLGSSAMVVGLGARNVGSDRLTSVRVCWMLYVVPVGLGLACGLRCAVQHSAVRCAAVRCGAVRYVVVLSHVVLWIVDSFYDSALRVRMDVYVGLARLLAS